MTPALSPALTLDMLLKAAGLDPADVRLLRHQDSRFPGYPSPYALWRDNRPAFEAYQSTQDFGNAARLRAPIWASFVGLPGNKTLFAGLYQAELIGPLAQDRTHPVDGSIEKAGSGNEYRLTPMAALADYVGLLFIEWGAGYRTWIQRADAAPKPIVEIRRVLEEDPFPGFTCFTARLSELETLPRGWAEVLTASRGVYLLTCPRDGQHYIGSATGEAGFMGRWREYAANGHGGNIALIGRTPSDFQVTVLEAAASSATVAEIIQLEEIWKRKLQTKDLGLNR